MNIPPPIKGLHKGFITEKQPGLTSFSMLNVRPKGATGRIIIWQRPGLAKWGEKDQVGAAENPVVAMCTVSSVV